MEISNKELEELELMLSTHGKKYDKLFIMWEDCYKQRKTYKQLYSDEKELNEQLQKTIIAQNGIIKSKPSKVELLSINSELTKCKISKSKIIEQHNNVSVENVMLIEENTQLKEIIQQLKVHHPDYKLLEKFKG